MMRAWHRLAWPSLSLSKADSRLALSSSARGRVNSSTQALWLTGVLVESCVLESVKEQHSRPPVDEGGAPPREGPCRQALAASSIVTSLRRYTALLQYNAWGRQGQGDIEQGQVRAHNYIYTDTYIYVIGDGRKGLTCSSEIT
jgi:hypothetical protein